MRALLATFFILGTLAACSNEPEPTLDQLTEAGVKALSEHIQSAKIEQQSNGHVAIRVEYSFDPVVGSGTDWNSLAVRSTELMRSAFANSAVDALTVDAVAPKYNNLHWAMVSFKKDREANFKDTTYLQQFATAEVRAGTLQTQQWLCEFYASYPSATPDDGLPDSCAR